MYIPTGEQQANTTLLAKDSAGIKSGRESDLHQTLHIPRESWWLDPEQVDGEQAAI